MTTKENENWCLTQGSILIESYLVNLLVLSKELLKPNWKRKASHYTSCIPLTTRALIGRYYKKDHTRGLRLLTALQRMFWIVYGGAETSRVTGECWIYRSSFTAMDKQMTASAPIFRTQQGWFFFQYVGIDCFCLLPAKHSHKADSLYLQLFTCFQMCEIYLEVFHSLITHSFLWRYWDWCQKR